MPFHGPRVGAMPGLVGIDVEIVQACRRGLLTRGGILVSMIANKSWKPSQVSGRELTKLDLVGGDSFFNGIEPPALPALNVDKSLREQSVKVYKVLVFDRNSEEVRSLHGKFMHAQILDAVESDRTLVIEPVPDGNLPK